MWMSLSFQKPHRSFNYVGIIRDSRGVFVEGFSCCRVGSMAPKLGEAMGVREALSWIKRRNLMQVAVETGSLMVVQTLRSHIYIHGILFWLCD